MQGVLDTPVVSGGAREDRDARLRQAIQRARRSAFYANHLGGCELESADDLPRLPLTHRHHLSAAGTTGMLAVPAARAWHYHESSGTTGEPLSTWCGLTEVELLADMLRELVPELSDETILLNRFPLFAPAAFIFEQALQQVHGCHVAAGNMTWDVPFRRALGFIKRLGVTALACLPLEPMLLAEIAEDEGLDLRAESQSLKVIFCGGAVLVPALRRIIERDWGARVVELYGSNEVMGLGLGCARGRLHLCSHMLEIEVLDAAGRAPVPVGEPGVLTVTSLVHEVMPLVRYFTGDLVRLDPTPCPCGDPRPTAVVLGRLEEVIELGGSSVLPYDVLDAAYEFADALGTRFFFVIVRNAGFHVRIEASPTAAAVPAAEAALRRQLPGQVTIEYLARNEVLDRSALVRTPKIYKPSLVCDWRKQPRKSLTIMESLLEWPHFDFRTLLGIVAREVRNGFRRRRLAREDTGT